MLLPPLLTIIFFLWAWNVIRVYVLVPVETAARYVLVWTKADILDSIPPGATLHVPLEGSENAPRTFTYQNTVYVPVRQLMQTRWIPHYVYEFVERNPGESPLTSAEAYYHRYVDVQWLPRRVVIPVFLVVFILILYLMGTFVTAPLGRVLWSVVESLINRLPLIRAVYGSVKQVTDFMLSDRGPRFNRIVAIEYPRKGIWSLAFVTGEGMMDVQAAANEPVLTVLVPSSPRCATGLTAIVLKSEALDLNITLDQAIQFIVSCGVVVPRHQAIRGDVAGYITETISQQDGNKFGPSAASGSETAP
jgi:uncharacterized membrane protein